MYRIDQRDSQLWALPAEICYVLSFERAERRLLDISIEVTTRGQPFVEFVLPSWTPGSYKIRDFVTDFTVEGVLDERGRLLEVEWRAKNRFRVLCPNAEKVYVKAVYFGNERSVRTTHLNRWYAFIMPSNCLPFVEGRQQEPHHLVVEQDPHRWRSITTPLSPVDGGFPPRFGALNYDILADSPVLVGNHSVRTFTLGDRLHEVAFLCAEPVDEEWLLKAVQQVVQVTWAFWGGRLPYDRFVFFLLFLPELFGGLEHARSLVTGVEPASMRELVGAHRFLRLLCHEFFHTWNGKRIRPEGLGPWDYERETYTPLLWLVEGVTSYYELLLTHWCGFLSQREFLVHLALELDQLAHVPGRFYLSVRDSSILAWVKLYGKSPDGLNRFPSYYLKGAIVAWLLDLWILQQTQGKKRLQDGMRQLWRRAQSHPERGMSEEEVLQALEEGTGVALRAPLMEWLTERGELPYEMLLPQVGLELEWEKAPEKPYLFGDQSLLGRLPVARFTGVTLREEQGGLRVEAVEEFSPAAAAGIAVGDEILALNGVRVRSRAQWDALIGMAEGAVEVLASSEGRIYTTRLVPEQQRRVRLQVRSSADGEASRLLEAWLRPPSFADVEWEREPVRVKRGRT
jgi:predicted metalloprotease with PDZ domain